MLYWNLNSPQQEINYILGQNEELLKIGSYSLLTSAPNNISLKLVDSITNITYTADMIIDVQPTISFTCEVINISNVTSKNKGISNKDLICIKVIKNDTQSSSPISTNSSASQNSGNLKIEKANCSN